MEFVSVFNLKLILLITLETILLTMDENFLNVEERLMDILLEKGRELSITEIVDFSGLPRSAVRTSLARLEGAGKVSFRKVGMAKLYSSNG